MGNPNDQGPISVVEDLDPEPRSSERSRRLGELVLGLALLLGVLAWGGWQWWHDTTMQAAYRQGSAAAERRDWDAARDAFRSASGYRDADTRAEDAARLALGRDSRYASATRALSEGNMLEALTATTELRQIQPDYRDTESLHERALKGAIDNALLGAGISRMAPVTGPRPGLYAGLGNGSVRLEGSDLSSLVRAGALDGPPGCAVYDAPSPGGRSMRLACVEGDGVRTESLDASLEPDDFDTYVAGRSGAWGLSVTSAVTSRYQVASNEVVRQLNRLQGALLNYDVTYLPAGGRAVPYSLADSKWIVMDMGDEGGLLLAVPVWPGPGGDGMGLYIEQPDGSVPRLLHEQEGGFISAHLGPGERYALITTYTPLPGAGEEHRVLLIDTATGAKTVLVSATSYSESTIPAPRAGGAIVRGGPLDGMVVAVHWAFAGEIALFDPERPDEPIAGLPVSGYPASQVYAAGSPEGLAAVGWSVANGGDRGSSAVKLAVLRPGGESALLNGPIAEGETLSSVAMRGDNAVYVTRRTGYPTNRRGPVRVRGLYAPAVSEPSEARVLYTEPPYDWSQMSARATRPGYSWHLGKEGVTYAQDGLLYVAPFDGGEPVVLAPGVEMLPFSGERSAEWVR